MKRNMKRSKKKKLKELMPVRGAMLVTGWGSGKMKGSKRTAKWGRRRSINRMKRKVKR